MQLRAANRTRRVAYLKMMLAFHVEQSISIDLIDASLVDIESWVEA